MDIVPNDRVSTEEGQLHNAIRHFLDHLSYEGKEQSIVVRPDPLIVGSVGEFFAETPAVLSARQHLNRQGWS